MRVKVKLLLFYKDKSPTGEPEFEMELAKGARVAQVLSELDIDPASLKVMLKNGRQAALDDELQPDDHLVIFPPLEGG